MSSGGEVAEGHDHPAVATWVVAQEMHCPRLRPTRVDGVAGLLVGGVSQVVRRPVDVADDAGRTSPESAALRGREAGEEAPYLGG
jgi:hypothetical protein